MEQEASQEFGDVEGHVPVGLAPRPVVPAKGDLFICESDESVVGDGHAVGVAAEIA
jgi:hypothetical protein